MDDSKTRMKIPLMFLAVVASLFLFQGDSARAEHEGTHLKDVRTINSAADSGSPGAERLETNPHGLFTSNTNTCSKCHSVHRGKAAKLLVKQTQEQTCYLCHDGRGSKYDVKNGKYFDKETGTVTDSVSGGFNGFDSSHDLEASHPAPGGNGSQIQVVCTSCHNPHGSDNHRNLQSTVNGKAGIEVKAAVSTSPLSHKEVISYESGITNFCVSCHEDYNTYYQENTVNNNQHYRHPIETLLTGGKPRIESSTVPSALSFNPSLITTLPTQGVPSGAYPNPETSVISPATLSSSVSTGGALASGDYYYVLAKRTAAEKEVVLGNKSIASLQDGSKVTLGWQPDSSARSFILYRAKKRKDAGYTPITKIMEANSSVSFTDQGRTIALQSVTQTNAGSLPAASYQYYLLAKSGGVTIGESNIIDVEVTSPGSGVSLSWDPIPGADSYELYRSVADGKGGFTSFSLLSTIDQSGNSIKFNDTGDIPLKPNPEAMPISQQGTLNPGTFYYIVTASNALGESHQGYIKKISVPSGNSSVNLVWNSIANAFGYKVYRAGPVFGDPQLADFKLISDSSDSPDRFIYKEYADGGYLLFTDPNLLSGTQTPPGINSQGVNAAKMVCTSCHYAHGTKKTDESTGNSHLKRMNNSGVCQDCHKK